MKLYSVKLSGWEGVIQASGIEEARYNAVRAARFLQARVLYVGEAKA
jgi:hypothetical protein